MCTSMQIGRSGSVLRLRVHFRVNQRCLLCPVRDSDEVDLNEVLLINTIYPT